MSTSNYIDFIKSFLTYRSFTTWSTITTVVVLDRASCFFSYRTTVPLSQRSPQRHVSLGRNQTCHWICVLHFNISYVFLSSSTHPNLTSNNGNRKLLQSAKTYKSGCNIATLSIYMGPPQFSHCASRLAPKEMPGPGTRPKVTGMFSPMPPHQRIVGHVIAKHGTASAPGQQWTPCKCVGWCRATHHLPTPQQPPLQAVQSDNLGLAKLAETTTPCLTAPPATNP